MTNVEYLTIFEKIINGDITTPPYDSDNYIQYTVLNERRIRRSAKQIKLENTFKSALESIDTPIHFELITEPWCGDAAHAHHIIQEIIQSNPLFTFNIQLRDSESEIDNYLSPTGGKAIPVFIARNSEGKDLFKWGPRPKEMQLLIDKMKAESVESSEQKIEIQKWYNKNKGQAIQKELLDLFNKTISKT